MRRLTVPGDELLAGFFAWLDTEEGMISVKANDGVAAALEGVVLDMQKRRIVWPDGKRLSIDQTVRRIRNKTGIDFHVIERHVICWLETGFEPNDSDEREAADFKARISHWIDSHKRERGEA